MAYIVPCLFGLGVYLQLTDHPSRVEAVAVAWAVGWATVNLVSFVANQYLAIPLDETFYLAVTSVLAIAGTVAVGVRRDRLRSLLRGPYVPGELRRGMGLGLMILFAGFLAFVFYKAFIIWPAHPDELIYHMELPKVAWQTGFLPLHPGLDIASQATAYPDLLVAQQLWVYLGAAAFDPNLLRPIMPIYTTLLLAVVFVDARRWFGLAAAGVAVAALFSLFSFTSLTILIMDEVPVAFYIALGLHFVVAALEGRGDWFYAGLFVGFAGLVKYDGLDAILAMAVALAVASRWRPNSSPAPSRQPRQSTVRISSTELTGFCCLAVLPSLPLLLRNLTRLANPVYPYFFGGPSTRLDPSLLAGLETPAVLTAISSSEVVSLLGTVLVASLLLGFIRYRSWTPTERLLLLFFAFYLPAYLSVPLLGSQIRYLSPLLPAMAIFGGKQLTWWVQESPRASRIRGTFLVVGLASFGTGMVVWAPFYSAFSRAVAAMTMGVFVVSIGLILLLVAIAARGPTDRGCKALALCLVLVLLTPGIIALADEKSEANPLNWVPNVLPQTRDAYLTHQIGQDWTMWEWMNTNLGANATVLSFDPRGFYLDAHIVSAISPDMMPVYNMSLPEAVSFVRGYGIDYVLDSQFGDSLFFNGFYEARSPIFQSLGNRTYFTPLHEEGTTVLYGITG